ncbi:MAG: helix-turn-helix transcriptional regulator [Patescibacteria group bacterium]
MSKRLGLRLSQAQVAEKAGTTPATVSRIEQGTYRPGGLMLEKISKALECEIPAELILTLGRREPRQDAPVSSVVVHLSGQNIADLEKIKELPDIRVNIEVVRKALKLLRRLLEKQSDGYVVCLRKDKDVIELEFMF